MWGETEGLMLLFLSSLNVTGRVVRWERWEGSELAKVLIYYNSKHSLIVIHLKPSKVSFCRFKLLNVNKIEKNIHTILLQLCFDFASFVVIFDE